MKKQVKVARIEFSEVEVVGDIIEFYNCREEVNMIANTSQMYRELPWVDKLTADVHEVREVDPYSNVTTSYISIHPKDEDYLLALIQSKKIQELKQAKFNYNKMYAETKVKLNKYRNMTFLERVLFVFSSKGE